MAPTPARYPEIPVYDLLQAASRGLIGVDRRFLHAILDDPAKAMPDLLRFASEDRSALPVDLDADLIAIFRKIGSAEALPFYIGQIRRYPEEAGDDLVEALAAIGKPAVDPLLALYEELDESETGDLAFCLAALHVRDERILKLLIERLDYDASEGAISLALYGDPAAIPEIERILQDVPESDGDLRQSLLSTIDDIRKAASAAEPEQFDIWDLYSETEGPRFDVLAESERADLLGSEVADYRAQAASSFRNEDFSTETRAALLNAARRDEDPNVRGRAWEALSPFAKDKDIRRDMIAIAANEDAALPERGGALVALADYADEPVVRSAIDDLYVKPEGRAKALEAMWRSLDRRFAPRFPKHLADPDIEIKRQTIWGIGYLAIHAEAGRLREFFDDEDLRADALFAYALAVPGETTRGRVRALFRKIEEDAGTLSEEETALVRMALDERLTLAGAAAPEPDPAPKPAAHKVGRNDPCPCGSGKKYKKCCGSAA